MAKTLDAAGVKRLIQEIKGANKNLNTSIPISMEDTPESMAQNVKNIADYVEKAKAAGIANVDGMGVTCIINNNYSAVGYLYRDTSICGIEIDNGLEAPVFFVVDPDGTYGENSVLINGLSDQITSDMLVEGARKPIIITGDMTEVDEETYKKLLSNNVDVVFKDASDVLYYIYDINNKVSELEIRFVTTLGSIDTTDPSDYWFSVAYVRISKNAPHTVTTESTDHSLQDVLNDSGYLNKSVLTPVLKKINLRRGNNSAVIRQFEADWENLNGSLFGARFIGFPAGTLPVLFMKDDFNDCYIGYTDRDIDGAPNSTGPFKKITLSANDNYNLKVTDVTATVQYIDLNATTTNLTSIGAVQKNTPHCFTYTKDSEIIKGVGQVWQSANYGYLDGISFDGKYRVHAEVQANGAATVTLTSIGAQKLLQPVLQEIDLRGTDADRKAKLDQFETDWKALTGASDLTGARFVGEFGITDDIERIVTGIMTYCAGDEPTEKNDNCFYGICNGYSFSEQKSQIAVKVSCTDGSLTITPLFSHLEAITIKTGNSAEDKADNKAAIETYRNNLTALGVDTTKGYMIPITASGRNGFLSTRMGNYPYVGYAAADSSVRDFYNILILGNGEYYDSKILPEVSDELHTISKQIVGAINEVNALAKGYSTIFTPIELTTETAQNKTAIDARVAAFTAQGISLTNGCCIPVTYKGVYAGNISLINGDWYGLLVKNTNNPADNINIKLSADGTITEGNSAQ